MHGVRYSLVIILALAGCDSLRKAKVDNPVMGPPPPRISFNNEPADSIPIENATANAEEKPRKVIDAGNDVPATLDPPIIQTSLETKTAENNPLRNPLTNPSNLKMNLEMGTAGNNPLSGSQTVAIVNGSPILASEVLERYGTQLAEAKEKLPPEQYEEARKMLIQRDLDSHIERKLLANGLKSMLKKEQIKMLNGFINNAFNQEMERMMKEAGVTSKLELEAELRKQHTSLANLKTNFANQRMAMEFLGTKTKSDVELGRPELLKYYTDYHEAYFIPARVKWQQILVDFRKHGGQTGAKEHLNKIIEKLKPTRGKNFTEVAQELSDGPNAANGGRWEWTKQGSLADKRLDQALFELPAGRPSQVFESPDSFKIVMVDQREESKYTPFNEVQDEIKAHLERENKKIAAQKFIEEIKAKAEITTIFDEPKTQQARNANEMEIPVRIH